VDAALATEVATAEDAAVADVTAFVCRVAEAELTKEASALVDAWAIEVSSAEETEYVSVTLPYTAGADVLLLAAVACTEALPDLDMVIWVLQLLTLDAYAVGAMIETLLAADDVAVGATAEMLLAAEDAAPGTH